jgi:hypothetical protein
MGAFLTKDLTFNQNEDFALSETYDPFGVPVDLSAYTAQMMVRVNKNDVVSVFTIATGTGITLNSAGVVAVSISHATVNSVALAMLPTERGFYDLILISPAGVQTRFLQGSVFIDPAVTIGAVFGMLPQGATGVEMAIAQSTGDASAIGGLVDGQPVEVLADRTIWTANRSSTRGLSSDVISMTGGGRLLRTPYVDPGLRVFSDSGTATLYVDPVNGRDSQSGSSPASAIKTSAEMNRRMSAYLVVGNVDVRYLSYPTGDSDPFRVDLDLRQAQGGATGPVITFYAPALAVDSSGSFSGVTPRSGNTPWNVSDGAVVTTGDPYKRIFIPSGPRAGSQSWVAKSTGAGGRRTSEWGLYDIINGGTYKTPQIGDPYQVLRATGSMEFDRIRVVGGQIHGYPNGTQVVFRDWDWINNGGGGTAYAENYNAILAFTNCRWDNFDNVQMVTPTAAIGSNTYVQNCCTTNHTGELRFQQGGPNQNFADGGLFGNLFADAGAGVLIDFDLLVDGSGSVSTGVLAASNNGILLIAAAGVMDGKNTWGQVIAVDGGRIVVGPDFFYGNTGRLWGSSPTATSYGVSLLDGGRLRVRTAAGLTVTSNGGAKDLRVGLTASTWAAFAAAGFVDDSRYDAHAHVSTGLGNY